MSDIHAPLSAAEQALREAACEYHRLATRGKISVTPTKPLSNQRDLSLAYSPGVAYPCVAIQADPSLAAEYTSRGNPHSTASTLKTSRHLSASTSSVP